MTECPITYFLTMTPILMILDTDIPFVNRQLLDYSWFVGSQNEMYTVRSRKLIILSVTNHININHYC